MRVITLVLVSTLLMGALAPSFIYFHDDFTSVDSWYVYSGVGIIVGNGIFRGEDTLFRKPIEEFDIENKLYEIVIDRVNGTWGLSFTDTTGNRILLYQNMDVEGTFTGKMLNAVDIDGVVIEVQGEVDFGHITISSQMEYGNPLIDWSEQINEFMTANPWAAPTGLSIIILFVGLLLLFGRKKR